MIAQLTGLRELEIGKPSATSEVSMVSRLRLTVLKQPTDLTLPACSDDTCDSDSSWYIGAALESGRKVFENKVKSTGFQFLRLGAVCVHVSNSSAAKYACHKLLQATQCGTDLPWLTVCIIQCLEGAD